jgi:hypothetical protein
MNDPTTHVPVVDPRPVIRHHAAPLLTVTPVGIVHFPNERPRPIVIVQTGNVRQAFYRHSRDTGPHGAQRGDWVPFEGFSEEAGAFPYRNQAIFASVGWMVKMRFYYGVPRELLRWGTEQNRQISRWLGQMEIPQPQGVREWQDIQRDLQTAGVPIIPNPVTRFGGTLWTPPQ